MGTNAFIGTTEQPTAEALTIALGPAKPVWDELLATLARTCEADVLEWKSYSAKGGWSLRVKRKQRTIVWLSPSTGAFTVLLILGAKAMQIARQSGLSKRLLEILDKAPKYPEGTGVRLEVKKRKILEEIEKLARIKRLN